MLAVIQPGKLSMSSGEMPEAFDFELLKVFDGGAIFIYFLLLFFKGLNDWIYRQKIHRLEERARNQEAAPNGDQDQRAGGRTSEGFERSFAPKNRGLEGPSFEDRGQRGIEGRPGRNPAGSFCSREKCLPPPMRQRGHRPGSSVEMGDGSF